MAETTKIFESHLVKQALKRQCIEAQSCLYD